MRQITAKLLWLAALGIIAAFALVSNPGPVVVRAVFAQGGCTNATLSGRYAFAFSGWGTPPPKVSTEGKSSIPVAAIGVATFDGAGNWTTDFTYSHNGDITSANSVPGTYTVNSNCTGAMTGVVDLAIVILAGGAEVTGIVTDKDSTTTFEMKKQNAVGCNNSTLTGNFAVTVTGFGTPPPNLSPGNSSVPSALAGLATLDGAGNFTGSFTLSHNGEISTLPSDVGTYTLSSDCTGTFTDATASVHFATVVLAGGAEVFGVQTDVGTATTLDAKKQ